jgi:hypothetical protein
VQNDFFCVKAESDEGRLYIGILSQGSGVQPSWILSGGNLLVGYNEQVAVFSIINSALVVVVNLLSLFFEFITHPSLQHICVLCETAVAAISSEGEIKWRVDTDVICDHTINNEVITLQLMDEPPMRIDLRSGRTNSVSS